MKFRPLVLPHGGGDSSSSGMSLSGTSGSGSGAFLNDDGNASLASISMASLHSINASFEELAGSVGLVPAPVPPPPEGRSAKGREKKMQQQRLSGESAGSSNSRTSVEGGVVGAEGSGGGRVSFRDRTTSRTAASLASLNSHITVRSGRNGGRTGGGGGSNRSASTAVGGRRRRRTGAEEGSPSPSPGGGRGVGSAGFEIFSPPSNTPKVRLSSSRFDEDGEEEDGERARSTHTGGSAPTARRRGSSSHGDRKRTSLSPMKAGNGQGGGVKSPRPHRKLSSGSIAEKRSSFGGGGGGSTTGEKRKRTPSSLSSRKSRAMTILSPNNAGSITKEQRQSAVVRRKSNPSVDSTLIGMAVSPKKSPKDMDCYSSRTGRSSSATLSPVRHAGELSAKKNAPTSPSLPSSPFRIHSRLAAAGRTAAGRSSPGRMFDALLAKKRQSPLKSPAMRIPVTRETTDESQETMEDEVVDCQAPNVSQTVDEHDHNLMVAQDGSNTMLEEERMSHGETQSPSERIENEDQGQEPQLASKEELQGEFASDAVATKESGSRYTNMSDTADDPTTNATEILQTPIHYAVHKKEYGYFAHVVTPEGAQIPPPKVLRSLHDQAESDPSSHQWHLTNMTGTGLLSLEDVLFPAVCHMENEELRNCQRMAQKDAAYNYEKLLRRASPSALPSREEFISSDPNVVIIKECRKAVKSMCHLGVDAARKSRLSRDEREAERIRLDQEKRQRELDEEKKQRAEKRRQAKVERKQARAEDRAKRREERKKNHPKNKERWAEVVILMTALQKLKREEREWKGVEGQLQEKEAHVKAMRDDPSLIESRFGPNPSTGEVDETDGKGRGSILATDAVDPSASDVVIRNALEDITLSTDRIHQALKGVSTMMDESEELRKELYDKYTRKHQFRGYTGVGDPKALLRTLAAGR